jgi:SAM-dependent methyltransferase
MEPFFRRVLYPYRRVRERFLRPVSHLRVYLHEVSEKAGLEIGGPSIPFRPGNVLPLYPSIGSLDNCDFSSSTTWAQHGTDYLYDPGKPAGRSYFCEGSNLEQIADQSYDFVLSAHNLEHFANPVKALLEWKRVLRPGGALVLILPFYRNTFDHRRSPTPVAAMMDDFQRDVGEDDLSHVPEILEKHDLARDPGAGTLDEFRQRCMDNFQNRCIHHHVFDRRNSRELLEAVGFEVLSIDRGYPFHLCLLARVSGLAETGTNTGR